MVYICIPEVNILLTILIIIIKQQKIDAIN